jgi:hypothetical protein
VGRLIVGRLTLPGAIPGRLLRRTAGRGAARRGCRSAHRDRPGGQGANPASGPTPDRRLVPAPEMHDERARRSRVLPFDECGSAPRGAICPGGVRDLARRLSPRRRRGNWGLRRAVLSRAPPRPSRGRTRISRSSPCPLDSPSRASGPRSRDRRGRINDGSVPADRIRMFQPAQPSVARSHAEPDSHPPTRSR